MSVRATDILKLVPTGTGQRGGPVFGPVSLLVNWGEYSAHSRAAVRITQVKDVLVQGQHAVGLRRW